MFAEVSLNFPSRKKWLQLSQGNQAKEEGSHSLYFLDKDAEMVQGRHPLQDCILRPPLLFAVLDNEV